MKWASRFSACLVSVYGIWSFINRDIGMYLLYRSHFVFFDFDESVWSFLIDYVAMMISFAAAGYYLERSLRLAKQHRNNRNEKEF